MMKVNIKNICLIVILFLIFIFMFDRLSLIMVRKGNGYGTDVLNFYKQERNSIDMVILGSSHSYAAFNPYLIEDYTGMVAYDFCTQQQPIWITYYYLNEVLKYQNPKYIVLDVHLALADYEYAEEQVNRDALDKMRFSVNKVDAIINSVEDDRMAYYFHIIKYHSRYKELSIGDLKAAFLGDTVDNKGYIALPENDYNYVLGLEDTSDILKLSNKSEYYLKKIIEVTDKNNIDLILVKTPAKYDSDSMKKLNYIEMLANEEDVMFINYIRNIDSLNLDYSKDFYDAGHLNKNGSEKFTKEFLEDINLISNRMEDF